MENWKEAKNIVIIPEHWHYEGRYISLYNSIVLKSFCNQQVLILHIHSILIKFL